jgi:hypothetical protein
MKLAVRAASLLASLALGAGFAVAVGGFGGDPARALHISCDGMITADLSGQDVIYQGKSALDWAGLGIRVDGQLRVFGGVALRRTPGGKAAPRVEIQSITGNGQIIVEWPDGDLRRSTRCTRLVIVPAKADGTSGKVMLGGLAGADRTAGDGLVWHEALRCWLPTVSHRPGSNTGH